MTTVFIAYPTLFNCYSKFLRKISRITSNLSDLSVVYFSDEKNFIRDFSSSSSNCISAYQIDVRSSDVISYAIIFDDGSLSEIIEIMKNKNIPLRVIKFETTKVVNKDKGEEFDVYIGRGSPWGNPYAVGFGGSPGEEQNSREEAIRKYKYDFDRDFLKGGQDYKRNLLTLAGKKIACHCKPLACHGDVLADYLNSYDDGM